MIPDYCEAITAYRCWNVFPNGLMVGQAHAEPWPPYEAFVGRCGHAVSPEHIQDGRWVSAPVMRCDCGVHALKEAIGAEQRILSEADQNGGWKFSMRWDNYEAPKGRVWGAVKLWGRLIEHQIGYRAEFAYPSALFCEDEALAATVAALYGVPCEVKKLERPKRKDEDDWYGSLKYLSAVYQPMTYLAGYQSQCVTVQSGASTPAPPSVVQPATVAQIKALGASKYQRKAAARAEVDKIAAAERKRDLIKAYLDKGALTVHGS